MKKQFKILSALGSVLIFAGSIVPIINLTSCGSKPGQKSFDPNTYVFSVDDINNMFAQLINGYREQAKLYDVDPSIQGETIAELTATFELKKEESLSAPIPSQYLVNWICETAKQYEVNIISWQYTDAHRVDYRREFLEKEGGTDNAEVAAEFQDEMLEQSSNENLNYNEMMEQLPDSQDTILQSILAKKHINNYTLNQQSKYQTACEAQMANLKQDLTTNISLNPNVEFYDYLTTGEEQENDLTNGDTTSYWANLLTNLDGSATPTQDPIYRFLTPEATATLFNYNYLEPVAPTANSIGEDDGFTRVLAPLDTTAGAIVKYKYDQTSVSGYSVKIAVQVTSRTDNTPVYSDVDTRAGYKYQVNYKIVLEDEDHKFVVPGKTNDESTTPIYSMSDAALTSDSEILWKKFVTHKFQELGLNNDDVVGAFGVVLNNDASWRGSEEGLDNYNVVKFSERYADKNQTVTPLIGAVLSPEDADAMIKIKNVFTPSDSNSWSSVFSNVVQDKTGTNPEYISVSQANEILSKFFDGNSQYQFKVSIAGVADWGDNDPKIILSAALFDTAKGSNMTPYKLVGMSTTTPPYGFTSENMSKLSFDNYKKNMTNDFNKIQIALPFSNEQLKNFEACNNMLQPGAMEKMDKIVNFCKPHLLDEMVKELKDLLSKGVINKAIQITFLVLWAIKLVADIIFLVLACLGTPFTAVLVIKCTINIATDAIAIASTSVDLAAQIDEIEKLTKLIELLETYEKNCVTNFEQIQTYYNTIKTELSAYKNSFSPTARADHSTTVVNTNTLLINTISQNCWNFWKDSNILAGIPNDKNIFFNSQSWDTWLDISTNITFIIDIATFISSIVSLIISRVIEYGIVSIGVIKELDEGLTLEFTYEKFTDWAQVESEEFVTTLSSSFKGITGRVIIWAQQSANVAKLIKGSSFVGMAFSILQLIANAILLAQKDGIISKIANIKLNL